MTIRCTRASRVLVGAALVMGCAGSVNAQQPNRYKALVDAAVEASAHDSLAVAADYYKQALEAEPANAGNSLLWGNLGALRQRMGQADAAIEAYSMALNMQPKLVPVLQQRAELYLDKGDKARAMLDFSAILDVQPNNEQALLGRAYLRMELRMFSESRLDFESLVLNYPQHVQGELGLAILCQKQERFQEAADRFANLIQTHPKEAYLYEARGNMEREAKLYELALIDYEEAGRLSKNDPNYLVMQALVYLDQDKKGSARRMLDRAVKAGLSRSSLQDIYSKCK